MFMRGFIVFMRGYFVMKHPRLFKKFNILACNIVLCEKFLMNICAPWANAIFQFQITITPDQEQAPRRADKKKGDYQQ